MLAHGDVTKCLKIRQAHAWLNSLIELSSIQTNMFNPFFFFWSVQYIFDAETGFICFSMLIISYDPHWKMIFNWLYKIACYLIQLYSLNNCTKKKKNKKQNKNWVVALILLKHLFSINCLKRNIIKFMLISMAVGTFYHLIA